MADHPFPYSFIAIEGNIGAGKTTLATRLAADFGGRLILEEFSDNPFLPFFYENPERYAFPVELFFMTERHRQLQRELSQRQLFEQGVVADYLFIKTLLFARVTLTDEEFRLFQRLFDILRTHFPAPDLLVYLHRPVADLQRNIRQRGRPYEQQLPDSYLQRIQRAYLDYFRTDPPFPVLLIDTEGVDFNLHPEQYPAIVQLLQQSYAPGLHRATVTPASGPEAHK